MFLLLQEIVNGSYRFYTYIFINIIVYINVTVFNLTASNIIVVSFQAAYYARYERNVARYLKKNSKEFVKRSLRANTINSAAWWKITGWWVINLLFFVVYLKSMAAFGPHFVLFFVEFARESVLFFCRQASLRTQERLPILANLGQLIANLHLNDLATFLANIFSI